MKIKPINVKLFCNRARFNENVFGKHLQIIKGKENTDKKDYASIMILNMMDEKGLFNVVFEQVKRSV